MYIGDFNQVCANSVFKFAEVDNADSQLIMQNSTLVSINVYHAEFYINSHTPEFEIQMVKLGPIVKCWFVSYYLNT